MDFNKIGQLTSGGGVIWQGGTADSAVATLPGPLVIVCMNIGESNEQFIDHHSVHAVLSVWINDSPDAVLPDNVLIALTDSVIALLNAGMNVYIHCAAGVSRSSYLDIAVHMRGLKMGFQQAYDLVKAGRPMANPNSGFTTQLQQLESVLIGK